MLLVKLPVAVPSLVCDPETDGLCDVLQQIPLVVTAEPPFDVIFPPAVEPVLVMPVAGRVVTDGKSARVVKLTLLP